MAVNEYIKKAGALQVFIFSEPIASRFLDKKYDLPFPPLGDDIERWRWIASLCVALFILMPFFMPQSTRRNGTVILLVCATVISALSYLMLENRYVVPLSDRTTLVIRGSIRNPSLRAPFATMSDRDLIEHSGTSDAFLEDAYTKDSIMCNRRTVFSAYLATLIFLQITTGYAVIVGASKHSKDSAVS